MGQEGLSDRKVLSLGWSLSQGQSLVEMVDSALTVGAK